MANLFHLYLHVAGHNLLVRIRQTIVGPLQQSSSFEIPTESLSVQNGKCYENDRRRKDSLGEAHWCTWRTHLITVAAEISGEAATHPREA